MTHLAHKTCVPCEVGGEPLSTDAAKGLLAQVPMWTLNADMQRISRTFEFPDFAQALAFANAVGAVAEAEGHHPDLSVSWGKVTVTLWTHAVGGLSENDFIMAAKIDTLSLAK